MTSVALKLIYSIVCRTLS